MNTSSSNVSRRPCLLPVNLSRRMRFFASRAVYVCEQLHVGLDGRTVTPVTPAKAGKSVGMSGRASLEPPEVAFRVRAEQKLIFPVAVRDELAVAGQEFLYRFHRPRARAFKGRMAVPVRVL